MLGDMPSGDPSPYAGCAVLVLTQSGSKSDPNGTPGKGSNATNGALDPQAMAAKFESSLRVDSIMKWVIKQITPLSLTLEPEHNDLMAAAIKATVHLSGAIDPVGGQDDLLEQLDERMASDPLSAGE